MCVCLMPRPAKSRLKCCCSNTPEGVIGRTQGSGPRPIFKEAPEETIIRCRQGFRRSTLEIHPDAFKCLVSGSGVLRVVTRIDQIFKTARRRPRFSGREHRRNTETFPRRCLTQMNDSTRPRRNKKLSVLSPCLNVFGHLRSLKRVNGRTT